MALGSEWRIFARSSWRSEKTGCAPGHARIGDYFRLATPTAALQTQTVRVSTASVDISLSYLIMVARYLLTRVPRSRRARARAHSPVSRANRPHPTHHHRPHRQSSHSQPVTVVAVEVIAVMTWRVQMKTTMWTDGHLASPDPDRAVLQVNANGEWVGLEVAPVPISCVQTTLDWA